MNKFKIVSIIILIILVISCICPLMSVGAADGLIVSASSTEGERGDTVEIALTVTDNPGFASLLITVPQIDGFELVSVENGSVMRDMTYVKNILWSSATNSTSVGTLVILTFKIGENAPSGVNSFDIIVKESFNDKFNAVNVEISSVSINVIGEPLVEETDASTTNETTETESNAETESNTETGSEIESESEVIADTSESVTKQEDKVDEPSKKPLIGCIGEIGVGAVIIISIIGTALFVKKKQ